jgi:hypothetical protein
MTKKEKKLISILIPFELYKEAKIDNNWSWLEIIVMGLQAKKNMPNVLTRQKEIEEQNNQIINKIKKLALEKFELLERIQKLEQNTTKK